MNVVGDAVRLAVGTLTVLPVRPPGRVDRAVAAVAMALAPVLVLPLAAAAAGVAWLADDAHAPPLLTAALTLATLAVGTGGLHLDGLADTADGLTVPGDASRRLEVMRRGDVGPAGAATLVLVLLVQAAALAAVAATRGGPATALTVALAVVVSRGAVTLACARGVPAARAQGLGSAVSGSVPVVAVVAVLASLVVVAGLLVGPRGVAGVAVAVVAAAAVLLRCRLRLGGVTGDVMGAAVELALAGYLVAQAVG